jgi:hypothetical protein
MPKSEKIVQDYAAFRTPLERYADERKGCPHYVAFR